VGLLSETSDTHCSGSQRDAFKCWSAINAGKNVAVTPS
jgi:hypothetical protein